MQQKEINVQISWFLGHADILGNEMADKLAKEAAQETTELEDESRLTTMVYMKLQPEHHVLRNGRVDWSSQTKDESCMLPAQNEYKEEVYQIAISLTYIKG